MWMRVMMMAVKDPFKRIAYRVETASAKMASSRDRAAGCTTAGFRFTQRFIKTGELAEGTILSRDVTCPRHSSVRPVVPSLWHHDVGRTR